MPPTRPRTSTWSASDEVSAPGVRRERCADAAGAQGILLFCYGHRRCNQEQEHIQSMLPVKRYRDFL